MATKLSKKEKKVTDKIEKQIARDVVRAVKPKQRIQDTSARTERLSSDKRAEERAFVTNSTVSMSKLEAETLKGVHTYVNPWTAHPRGVPAGKPPSVATTMYTVRGSTTVVTNAAGFASFLMTAPGWIPDATSVLPQPDASSRIFGLTQGLPVWWTKSTYSTSTVPAAGSAAAGSLDAWTFPTGIIPGILAQNYVRVDGAGFWVYPESPATTTQGDIMAYRFKDLNRVGASGYNSNGASRADLAAMDESMITTEEASLTNWKEGHAMHMALLPTSMCAQLYTPVPATGYTLSPLGYAGFVVSGAAANQTLIVEWVYQISCTNTVSYRADDNVATRIPISAPSGSAPRAELMEHYAKPSIKPKGSEKGGEAAKVVLHDKLEKSAMTKPEAKGWLQSAVDWGFENLGPIVSTVAEVGSIVAALL